MRIDECRESHDHVHDHVRDDAPSGVVNGPAVSVSCRPAARGRRRRQAAVATPILARVGSSGDLFDLRGAAAGAGAESRLARPVDRHARSGARREPAQARPELQLVGGEDHRAPHRNAERHHRLRRARAGSSRTSSTTATSTSRTTGSSTRSAASTRAGGRRTTRRARCTRASSSSAMCRVPTCCTSTSTRSASG